MITVAKTLEIQNIEFLDNQTMMVKLSNDRTFLIPLDKFPAIKNLNTKERLDFEIIDGANLSFLSIDEIYSLDELIGL